MDTDRQHERSVWSRGLCPRSQGAANLPRFLVAAGSHRRACPRGDPRAPGYGLRRARRAAARDRPLYDDRLPRWVRVLRSVAHPRARAGFLGVAADLRGHHTAARRRRSDDRDRARRDDGVDGRRDRGRTRSRQARVRRGPAVQRGPGRLHEWSRDHHPRRAVAQTVRLFDGRRWLRRRDESLRLGSQRDEHDGPADRSRHPGHPAGLAASVEEGACGARGGGRRNRRDRRLRPGGQGGRDRGVVAEGVAHTDVPGRAVGASRTSAHRGDGHRPGLSHRYDRDLDELRRAPGGRGRSESGDDRDGRGQRRRGPVPGVRDLGERVTHGRCRGGRVPSRR